MSFSVLICDDASAVRTTMHRLLEREGLTVAGVASNAEEVLTLYESKTPDVVLLDLKVPGSSGLGLLRALRILDPQACVVICSGAGDPDMREEAESLGVAEWVLKPVYTSSLVELLREIVTAKRARAGSQS